VPYTQSGRVRIHYDVVGIGPPLVLHHWTFSSLDWWTDLGYVQALEKDATLVLIDSRGHGASDQPTDPALYTLEKRVQDVTCVLDDLGLSRAHFFGFSMGGWIGFGMARYAQERLCSLVVGGAHPFAQSMRGIREYLAIGSTRGARAFLETWEADAGPVTSDQRNRILQFNHEAMIAAAQDRADLGAHLSKIDVPCLLLVGENDPICQKVRSTAERIPSARLETLPGKGHGETIRDVERIAPLVLNHIRLHKCPPFGMMSNPR
jgi:pimeloyl-ACP methyl ester carboxylesterase